jgi:hypothetical protein
MPPRADKRGAPSGGERKQRAAKRSKQHDGRDT